MYSKIMISISTIVLFSCKSGKDDKSEGDIKKDDPLMLAQQVCDCKTSTKGMKYNDPERTKIWKGCLDMQGTNYKKLETNKADQKSYSSKVAECTKAFTLGN